MRAISAKVAEYERNRKRQEGREALTLISPKDPLCLIDKGLEGEVQRRRNRNRRLVNRQRNRLSDSSDARLNLTVAEVKDKTTHGEGKLISVTTDYFAVFCMREAIRTGSVPNGVTSLSQQYGV